jgi:hypothetical protein
VAFSGFAEEDGLDAASGMESLLDEADALDSDAPGFSRQAAA